MKKSLAAIGILISLVAPLFAQASQKLDPVFPAVAPGLIYLEGEDAVSTNFAKEPTLDYASSGLLISVFSITWNCNKGSYLLPLTPFLGEIWNP